MNEKKKTRKPLTDRQIDLAIGMVDDPLLRIGIEAQRRKLTNSEPITLKLFDKIRRIIK